MSKTKTYTPKAIENWRSGQNEGGVSVPSGTAISQWAQLAELSGKPTPSQLGRGIEATYRAIEHRQEAARLNQTAQAAVDNALARQREADSLAAMKAARSGDFAEVLDALDGPDLVAEAEAEARKARRILDACDVASKAAGRDLAAEGKTPEARKYLAAVWEEQVVGAYTGDSLKAAAAHESAANALRVIVTQLAIATDPDADDPLVTKHLRKALRESNDPALPTAAALRNQWRQATAEEDEAIAKAAAEKRAVNIESAAENARYRNAKRAEVTA